MNFLTVFWDERSTRLSSLLPSTRVSPAAEFAGGAVGGGLGVRPLPGSPPAPTGRPGLACGPVGRVCAFEGADGVTVGVTVGVCTTCTLSDSEGRLRR